jgi:hypothetical protein
MRTGREESRTNKPMALAMSASSWCAYRDHRPTTNTFRLLVVAISSQEPGI